VGAIAHLDIGPDDPVGVGRIPLGRPEPGVQVRLEALDDDPDLTQLLVASPRVYPYLSDPELTASRYLIDEDGTRWWRSRDLVRIDDDGVLHHLGRADEAIKVRGAFVAPSRVDMVLQSIDGIGSSTTVLHRTENGSFRIIAHVQVVDDALTPERVDAVLRERLPPDLVPAIVMRHDELPRNQRMKVDREALEAMPLLRWRSSRRRPPKTLFEWWCQAEVRRITGLDDLGPDDDLFDAGLDSLGALELGAALADADFGDFDPPRLFEARTIAGLERAVKETREPNRSAVVVLNPEGHRPPVFALPGGASNALEHRFLAEALGPDQPVAVIELRGMHSYEPPDRTMDARASQVYEESTARLGPDDPLVIMGFSGGGPAAYETAQRAHADGRPVHLVLLDSAPTTRGRIPTERPPAAGADPFFVAPPTIRTAPAKELPQAAWRSVRYRAGKRWREHRLRRLTRDPGPPNYERLRYLAFQQIQIAFNNAYEPQPSAFPATLVTVERSDALHRCGDLMPDLVVHVVTGEHMTMLLPPHVDAVASIVAAVTRDAALGARSR
jgi:thioesterase domain-containing protein